MSEFRRILGEAIGEASMCWSKPPYGVFESARASAIVDRILDAFHLEAGMGVTRYTTVMTSLKAERERSRKLIAALEFILPHIAWSLEDRAREALAEYRKGEE